MRSGRILTNSNRLKTHRDGVPRRIAEESDHALKLCRPLLPYSARLQPARILVPEPGHIPHQVPDEFIGGGVRWIILHVQRAPLHQRSTSVHMKHARLHMGPAVFGRDRQPAAREPRQQQQSDGCGPVLAMGTWEAGLITTRPLLQKRLDRNIFG